jgi:LAGLIDADG DNA endonuclease family
MTNNIYELLTPVALAHWIPGYGSAKRHGLILFTNSFIVQDVVKLINVLIIRYNLDCNIRIKKSNRKVEYMIYIRQSSMVKFLKIC